MDGEWMMIKQIFDVSIKMVKVIGDGIVKVW